MTETKQRRYQSNLQRKAKAYDRMLPAMKALASELSDSKTEKGIRLYTIAVKALGEEEGK